MKKAVAFIKNYWYIPLAIIAGVLVLLFVSRDKGLQILKMFTAAKIRYEGEIAVIKANQKEKEEKEIELEARAALLRKKIDEDFKIKEEELDKKKQKEIKILVEKYGNDYDTMAKEFAKEFNLAYEAHVE